MKGVLTRWLLLTIAIILTAYLMDRIQVAGFVSALLAAAALGLLNTLLRPVLLILTLPINILSLGLFTFIINAVVLKFASGLISGFHVEGFWAAVFGSLSISIINYLLTIFINDNGKPGKENFIKMKYRKGKWERE